MFIWYLQFSWRDLWSFLFYCFPLFLYTVHLERLYLSLLFPGTLHSSGFIFPLHPCLSDLFSAICKASSDNHLAFLHFFFSVMVWSPPPVQYYESPSIVLQALCLPDLIPWIYLSPPLYKGHDLGGSDGKASVYNTGDLGSIPGSGRSTGEGNDNPLQYYCLENPMEEEPGRLQSMGSQGVRHSWAISLSFKWPSGFPYFLQFKPEFCNKELMIWATVNSRSCFCCLTELLHRWMWRT